MTSIEKLDYWRKHLSCEEQVKMQLAEEYANTDNKEEIKLLDEIWELVYSFPKE